MIGATRTEVLRSQGRAPADARLVIAAWIEMNVTQRRSRRNRRVAVAGRRA